MIIIHSEADENCVVNHSNPSANSLERLYGTLMVFPFSEDAVHLVDPRDRDPSSINVHGMLCNGMSLCVLINGQDQ